MTDKPFPRKAYKAITSACLADPWFPGFNDAYNVSKCGYTQAQIFLLGRALDHMVGACGRWRVPYAKFARFWSGEKVEGARLDHDLECELRKAFGLGGVA